MTKITYILIAIFTFTTCSENNISTIAGHVIESSNNYITIVTQNNDTLSYAKHDVSSEKVLYLDSVIITYFDTLGVSNIKNVVVVDHKLPCINNRTAMLIGTWQSTLCQHDADNIKLTFNIDNTIHINTIDERKIERWFIDGNCIMTHNNDLAQSDIKRYDLIRVDNTSLIVADGDRIVQFAKIE